MGEEQTLFPMPRWFFDDVLFRSRNAAILLWTLMRVSLETGNDLIEASFMELSTLTGLHSPAISEALTLLASLGYVQKIAGGHLASVKEKAAKSHYRVLWNARGEIQNKVKEMFAPVPSIPPVAEPERPDFRRINDIISSGGAVRVGRFGEETGDIKRSDQWYSKGYVDRKPQFVKDALSKAQNGQIDTMKWRDFYYYFQEKYFERYGEYYISDARGFIQGTLLNLLKKIGPRQLFTVVDWLVNIQTIFERPGLHMLGSTKYFRAIWEGAQAYEKAKETMDSVIQ